MASIITSDKYYKALGIKIKNVLGTVTGHKPSEMPQAIKNMQTKSDVYNNIVNGGVVSGGKAYVIGDKMYTGMFAVADIHTCEIPETVTELSDYAFYYSTVENVILHDKVVSIGSYCFGSCDNLATVVLPESLTTIKGYAFYWSDIKYIDIPSKVSSIETYTFNYCKELKAVILRRTSSICSLQNVKAFTNSLIEDGTGYIYVPSALLNSYKTATNWSTFANQFRALEDYTVDGTVTGEFDYSKI